MPANQKTVALENSRKGFRNAGKVFLYLLEKFGYREKLGKVKRSRKSFKITILKLETNLKGNVLVPPKFLGSSTLSYMGADHPIAMVLLIFICLFGITTSTKGASFIIETKKFVELLAN